MLLKAGAVTGIGATGYLALRRRGASNAEPVVILKANQYDATLQRKLREGLIALGFAPREIAGKRVVLKPNLVEPTRSAEHVNTHPLLIQATVDLFRSFGAASVTVAEGAGHVRDPYYVLEESGLLLPLADSKTPFVDLNFAPVVPVPNRGGHTRMKYLMLPKTILEADILVSMAKMKTHHWAGVTLSMKNLFGVMPGAFYGWPKTVLHAEKVPASILDINATVRPHLAIVDGIVGMGGDGPIMGTPVNSGVLVFGTNQTAVDATCARIMGVSPDAVNYLKRAAGILGPIAEPQIEQRGETIASVRTDFPLLEDIPAHRGLRA